MADEIIETKKVYMSRTMWINIISLVAILIQSQTEFVIDPAAQTVIVNFVNMFLRTVTGKPLE